MRKFLFCATLLALIFVCSSGLFAYENPIRVRLGYSTAATVNYTVQVDAGQYALSNAAGTTLAILSAVTTVAIKYEGNAYTVTCGSNTYTGTGRVTLAAKSTGSVFSYGEIQYTGDMYCIYNSNNSTNYLINYLGMEEYLYGVIGREVGYNAPVEALKAQAVASRCLGYHWKNVNATTSYDVTNTTTHQVYGGYSERTKTNWDKVKSAVDATANQVMYYTKDDGTTVLVQAYYCSNTGGHTADVEDVWGSNPATYPYLRGVVVPTDGLPFQSYGTMKFPTGYTWTKAYTWAEMKKTVETASGKILGVMKSIVIDRGGNTDNRIETIKFIGTADTATFTRSAARTAFDFRSQLYDVIVTERFSVNSGFGTTTTISPGDFDSTIIRTGQYVIFKGRGYGHGVGMSQWSACVLAGQGYDYKYILNYFFNQNLTNSKLTFAQYSGMTKQ